MAAQTLERMDASAVTARMTRLWRITRWCNDFVLISPFDDDEKTTQFFHRVASLL
jgi:hypothetical protein